MPIEMVSPPAPEGLVRNAAELRAGDYLVYPGQGVHRVAAFERMDIAGQRLDVVKLEREHDGATVIVPVDKVPSIGLRRVAERELVEDVFNLLGAPARHVELDWKERHRGIGERLASGGVLGVAEVVKELQELAQTRPPPPKEREQYDEARHLLVHEIAVSMGVPPGLAEDYVDYALTPPAGVELPLRPPPPPQPRSAGWMSLRRERRPPAEEREEVLRLGEIELEEAGPGEEGAPVVEEAGEAEKEAGRPRRAKPVRRKPGARAARPTKRRAGKKRPSKKTSRSRR